MNGCPGYPVTWFIIGSAFSPLSHSFAVPVFYGVISPGNHTTVYWRAQQTERGKSSCDCIPGCRVPPAPIYSRSQARPPPKCAPRRVRRADGQCVLCICSRYCPSPLGIGGKVKSLLPGSAGRTANACFAVIILTPPGRFRYRYVKTPRFVRIGVFFVTERRFLRWLTAPERGRSKPERPVHCPAYRGLWGRRQTAPIS